MLSVWTSVAYRKPCQAFCVDKGGEAGSVYAAQHQYRRSYPTLRIAATNLCCCKHAGLRRQRRAYQLLQMYIFSLDPPYPLTIAALRRTKRVAYYFCSKRYLKPASNRLEVENSSPNRHFCSDRIIKRVVVKSSK